MLSLYLLITYIIAACVSTSDERRLLQIQAEPSTTDADSIDMQSADLETTSVGESDDDDTNTDENETTSASGDDDDDDTEIGDDNCIEESYLNIGVVADACSVCVCGDSGSEDCMTAVDALAEARENVNNGLAAKIIAKCNFDCTINFLGLTDEAAAGSIDECSCDVLECKDDEVTIGGSTGSSPNLSVGMAMTAVLMVASWVQF